MNNRTPSPPVRLMPPLLVDLRALHDSVAGKHSISDDTIFFTFFPAGGISRVPAAGGEPEALSEPEALTGHLFPRVLPDGNSVLFSVYNRRGWDESRIGVLSLVSGEWKLLELEGAASAYYAPSGHLVYARAGTLLAAPFDPGKLEVTGPPVPVLKGLITTFGAEYALSADGSLVYVPSSNPLPQRSLVWINRTGRAVRLPFPRQHYWGVRLSPDGRRLATAWQ